MKSHEYIVICGFNRSKVGRYIAIVASVISFVLILLALTLIEWLKNFHINSHIPASVFSLISAGGIYMGLYTWFDKNLWHNTYLGKFYVCQILQAAGMLKAIPDLRVVNPGKVS